MDAHSIGWRWLAAAALLAAAPVLAAPPAYDAEAALQRSQAAVGGRLSDLEFTDRDGRAVLLADYRKPLLISLIFTSCYHTCPVTSRYLRDAVLAAREVLDEHSFQVLTIGFDSANDTPAAMRAFARTQALELEGWEFLSGTPQSIARLTDEVGFVYFPSPRGFDHIVQATVVDRRGHVHAQVYGETFELPWLVEPLKEVVYDRARTGGHPIAGLIDRIRLFCTVYDPTTGRYQIDYSLFVQFAIGLLIVSGVAIYLVRESRRRGADG